MLNRFIESLQNLARKKAVHAASSTSLSIVVYSKADRFIATAHRTLTVTGVAAIVMLGIIFVKPDVADHIKTLSPFTVAESDSDELLAQIDMMDMSSSTVDNKPLRSDATTTTTAPEHAMTVKDKQSATIQREQQLVTTWIARRYRVAKDAANMLVSAAYLSAIDTKLDPLLILSVMAIESRFNPYAESPVGAQGLMQVMSNVHHDKFQKLGGVKAALNPVANIKVGSQILREYVKRGGSVEAGLKLYVGAANFETDFGYGSKVLDEYQRLKAVAVGKKVPAFTSTPKPPQSEPVIVKTPVPIEADMTTPATPNIANHMEHDLLAVL